MIWHSTTPQEVLAELNVDHKTGLANGEVDERIKEYDLSEMDMIDHGYASTVHKAQGLEFSTVIMNLQCAHYIMLTRPLVYTAITRGKKKVIIVGERKALCTAIKRTDTDKRGTCLAKRMQDIINSKE
jgi:exodeoxyribonuclease V alpha subunit